MQALSIYRRVSHHLLPRGRIQLLWPAMRRSPAADHLAATPVARLRLRTAHEASQVCSTAPASDHVIIAMGRRPETSRFGRASGAREERRSCAFWHLGKPFRTRNMQPRSCRAFFVSDKMHAYGRKVVTFVSRVLYVGGMEVLCQRWRQLMIHIPTCAQEFRKAEAAVCKRRAGRNAAEKAFLQAQYITM